MFLNDEVTVAVLSPTEDLLGFLHPGYVELEETNKLGALRTLEVTHPLRDDKNQDLTKYADLLVHGNKLWRQTTSDGDSCLYIILDDREVDVTGNYIRISAEEAATELSLVPPVRVSCFTEYFEDFEDGEYGRGYTDPTPVREYPYSDWLLRGGTAAMETGNPIVGTYSLKHTGNGSVTIGNRLFQSCTSATRPVYVQFRWRLATVGLDAYAYLWIVNYQDSSNFMLVQTFYNSSEGKQKLQVLKYVAGTPTNISLVDWKTGILNTSTEYLIKIVATDTNIRVYVDGVEKINATYTHSYTCNAYGFGATRTTAAVWDEIGVQSLTPSIETITINSTHISELVGSYFTPDTITAGQSYTYTGVISLMGLLREIESQTGYEFEFQYEYNPATKRIDRLINFLPSRGKAHSIPIEVGYNTDSVAFEQNESEVALAAAPSGEPSDDQTENLTAFHRARWHWEIITITPTSGDIPLWVTKDDDGEYVYGPDTTPTMYKYAGKTYVTAQATDSSAEYVEIQNKSEDGDITQPRTVAFSTSEEHVYNLFWLCVTEINKHLHPSINLEAKVIDLQRLQGDTPTYFNVGDAVTLKLPGSDSYVLARVLETVKNPREPSKDSITLGNYKINFFNDYLNEGGVIRPAYTTI